MLLGINIGGTKCSVSVGVERGRVTARTEFATCASAVETLEQLEEEAHALLERHENSTHVPDAIGISCGGPLDAVRGVILSPPNLPGWTGVPVVEFFQKRFGGRAFLQNDANACALAEWKHGAGHGTSQMIFCTMGTGFGCGLILNGRLYEGANGNAGELGHVRLSPSGPSGFGKAGSVEGYCGGSGIARLAGMRLSEYQSGGGKSLLAGMDLLTAKTVAEAAESGDELARSIYREVGTRLGQALAVAIDFLNPECIVLGSIFVRCEHLIRPSMEETLQREALSPALHACRIKAATLGESIGDVAALTVAEMGIEQ